MATRTSITLICDLCDREDVEGGTNVVTHALTVDGEAVEAEVCTKCWKPLEAKLARLRDAGRTTGKPKRGRKLHVA